MQKAIKKVLVSHAEPATENSPYHQLAQEFGLEIDFLSFVQIDGVPTPEFRKQNTNPLDFSAIIFTGKPAIDHFFRICEELRVKMPIETKYFCITEAIANYLQKFIIFRKRKVFSGARSIEDLGPSLKKHKGEKYLLPCSNLGAKEVTQYLDDNGFNWKDAVMYNTVSSDLSDLSDVTYDVLVFFSPQGIESLYDNFPDFKQNETRIAVFGNTTRHAVEERGLVANIKAPSLEAPSMTGALELYLQKSNRSE